MNDEFNYFPSVHLIASFDLVWSHESVNRLRYSNVLLENLIQKSILQSLTDEYLATIYL